MKAEVMLNLRALWGRAYPRVIGANREPSWLFFDAFLPVLSLAAYVFIYQSLFRGSTDPIAAARLNALVGFVVLGGTMIAFWLNVLWSMASQLYWEKEIGNLSLFMMAPMSRIALLAGMAIGGMFTTAVRAIFTLVLGVVIFNVTMNLGDPMMLLAVFFVTLIALYAMGMMFASLYLLWGREAWHISALLEEPIFLVSGFYFPVKALGTAVAYAATIIPATLGLDALRQMMFPGALGSQLWIFSPELELAILLVLAILFLALARACLSYMENLARREGRLTTRHQ